MESAKGSIEERHESMVERTPSAISGLSQEGYEEWNHVGRHHRILAEAFERGEFACILPARPSIGNAGERSECG
jgi:hypothetical protein